MSTKPASAFHENGTTACGWARMIGENDNTGYQKLQATKKYTVEEMNDFICHRP